MQRTKAGKGKGLKEEGHEGIQQHSNKPSFLKLDLDTNQTCHAGLRAIGFIAWNHSIEQETAGRVSKVGIKQKELKECAGARGLCF